MNSKADRKQKPPVSHPKSRGRPAAEERPRRWAPLFALAAGGFGLGVIGMTVATNFRPAGPDQPGEPPTAAAPPTALREAPSPGAEAPSANDAAKLEEIRRLKAEALRVADELVGRFPSDPHAIAVSAQLAFRLGDSAGAIEAWQQCLQVDPDSLDAHYKMALIAAKQGRYRAAEEHYRDLLAKGPRSSYAMTGLAETLLNLGRVEEALEILHEEQRLHPRSPAGLVLLGQTHLQLGEHQKARECFAAAVEAAPELAKARHGLAMACARLGQTEKARRHQERFLSLKTSAQSAYPDPGGLRRDLESIRRCVALVHTGAGEVYQRHGNLAKAERHYRTAAAADPNDTSSRFEEVGLLVGAAYNYYGAENASMGVDCGDYNNDGWLDFFMTNYQSEMPVLYKNLGGGALEDVTLVTGAGSGAFPYVNWGNGLVDLDNDGDRDLFVACGHLQDNVEQYDDTSTYHVRNLLLMNTGDGKFVNVSERAGDGLDVRLSSRGAGFDDLDNDGDLDVVVLNSRREPTVIRNDSPRDNHWIQIRLRGTSTNRDGVGARVRVVAGDLVQTAEVHSGRSYQSHYGTRLHFGLADRDRVDRIEVSWIGGGTDTIENVPADRRVTITGQ